MEAISNWQEEEGGLKIINIIKECDNLPDGELADILDEDGAISLLRPSDKNAPSCHINLESKQGHFHPIDSVSKLNKQIASVLILSEARVIEVYTGKHEEYNHTFHGELMGDFGDSKIFKIKIVFDALQEYVLLKFKGLCNDSSLWIYAFYIQVKTRNFNPESEFGHFKIQHSGQSDLKSHGIGIEKMIDKIKFLMNKNNNDERSEKLDLLMGMLDITNGSKTSLNQNLGSLPLSDRGFGGSADLINKMFESILSKSYNGTQSTESTGKKENSTYVQLQDSNLETNFQFSALLNMTEKIIDNKISRIEERLINRLDVIEQQNQENKEKLDRIEKLVLLNLENKQTGN